MKLYKISSHIFQGLLGIFLNKNLNLITKLKLYKDYFLVIILISRSLKNRKFTNYLIYKKFYVSAFNRTIFYPNIYSFFFLFNEIFCKAEYPSIKMLNNYIDLGANIGMSIIWYNLFNPSAKIYAYEPDPICYKYLKKTLKINHIANVSIFKKAVSNRTGKVKFFRILDNIQQLDSGLTLNQSLPHKVYVIKTQKLSTLLKKIKKIDLIKMDIEGAEYKVFQDLFSTNSISKVTTIIFEAHIFNKTEENQYKSILKKLQKLGLVTSHKNSIYSTINFWTKK